MARHYTTTEGVVYTNTLLNEVTEHDSGKDFAFSRGHLIAGAKAVVLEFTGDETGEAGEGQVTIQVSIDGEDSWRDYKMLIENKADSETQQLTRVESFTVSDDGSYLFFMSPETLGGLTHIRAKLQITSAGKYTVKANIAY